jgi:hypothetical protein
VPCTSTARGTWSTIRIRSAGTTARTADAGTTRVRRRPQRTTSSSGAFGSVSACTASTVPRAPPVTAKPMQFATQYRATGLEAENLLL